MREILFRGQKPDTKEWVYGSLLESSDGRKAIVVKNKGFIQKQSSAWLIDAPCYDIIPESVGQFTGKLDSHKIKIFVGDIVSMDNDFEDPEISEVKYAQGGFIVEADFGDYDMTTIGWAIELMTEVKVIGNIHDNPELIK